MDEAPSPDRPSEGKKKRKREDLKEERAAPPKGKNKKVVPVIRYEIEPRVIRLARASDFKAVVQKLTGMPTAKNTRNNSSSSSDPFSPKPFSSSSSEPLHPFSSEPFDPFRPITFEHYPYMDRYDSNTPSTSRTYDSGTLRRNILETSRLLSGPRYESSDPDPMQMMPTQPHIGPSTNYNNNMRFMPTPSTTPSGSSTSMGYNLNIPTHPQANYNPSPSSVQGNFNNHNIPMHSQPFNMHNPTPFSADSVQANFNNNNPKPFSGQGFNPTPLSHPNMQPSSSKSHSGTAGSFSVPLTDDDIDDALLKFLNRFHQDFDDDDNNDGM